MINIREAGRDDLYFIAAFLDECWRDAYAGILSKDYLKNLSTDRRHERYLERYDTGRTKFLAMYEKNQMIGVAVYGESMTDGYEDDGEISAIYFSRDNIGKGYGHMLFTEAEWLLREMGYKNFILDVFTENERAIRFYQKHGYHKIDERTIKIGDDDYPMIVLRKSLE